MTERARVRPWWGGRVVLFALCILVFATQPVSSQDSELCGASTDQSSRRYSIRLNLDGEPFRGSLDARVAIIEYGDYQCSHCARFKRELYPKLDANYLKTAKLRYVYRDLPLASHPNSLPAARAAYCARGQGKYWEMHEGIFALGQSFSVDDIVNLAAAIGLHTPDFEACFASDRSKDEIVRSARDARLMQIASTPTFLIGMQERGGRWFEVDSIIVGVKALADYEAIIDRLIAESGSINGCKASPDS